jgi:hypothetical protein
MSDIITIKKSELSEEQIQKIVEKNKEVLHSIPCGKYKSGRVWKEKADKFSDLVYQKPQRTSWEKKKALKQELKVIKEHEKRLKEEKKQKKIELVRRQKLNEERRKENEKKAEVVQSVRKIKKYYFIFF